jgi:dienelactone hydrolase
VKNPAVVSMLIIVCAVMLQAQQPQQPQQPEYTTFYYTAHGLHLEGYFYKPAGDGPFPLVIYNHGSRAGAERTERPMAFIGNLLTKAGYAVIVPERRGYGKSDGRPFSEEIGTDRGPSFLARLDAEADDVLAALEYAKSSSSSFPIDPKHVAIMGWSFGGIVTTLAAGKSGNTFVADINQAAAALNWDQVPALREKLIAAAGKTKIPVLCMAAENDATTENAKQICAAVKAHGGTADVIIYPPFTPAPSQTPAGGNGREIPPGHLIFSAQGVERWGKDVLTFLAKYLGPGYNRE